MIARQHCESGQHLVVHLSVITTPAVVGGTGLHLKIADFKIECDQQCLCLSLTHRFAYLWTIVVSKNVKNTLILVITS